MMINLNQTYILERLFFRSTRLELCAKLKELNDKILQGFIYQKKKNQRENIGLRKVNFMRTDL